MLTKVGLQRSVPLVRARMGKSGEQLEQLIGLLEADGSANLAKVLKTLYPRQKRGQAQASLRQFRLALAKATKAAGVSLALAGDKKTRTVAEKRRVWFEGEDRLAEAAERWVRPNLEGPERFAQDAVKLGPTRLYVVYADADAKDAERLLRELNPHLKAAGIDVWSHAQILPGEEVAKERAQARASCDLTLQLLSPHFQAENLGPEHTARVIPVVLCELTHELQDIELFRYRGKSFDHFDRPADRRDFARELFLTIKATLEKNAQVLTEHLRVLAEHGQPFVSAPARWSSFERDIELQKPVENRGEAMDFLFQWLLDPKAPRYCALLGELGMGKTTTSQEFARRLWDMRKQGKKVPAAIFLDLRMLGDSATRDPDLDEIVGRILKREWKGGPRSLPPQPEEIYKLVEDGALAIFDGLDEVLVHLTPSQGQLFTRQLFRMVPPNAQRGRLLITCRTHYFRTLKEQSAHFTLQERDRVEAKDYRALVLLPFGEEQIRTYLKNTLPERNVDQVWEFLQSVHNLPELAERPYTLSVIARQFARLEQWKAEGKNVTGLTLYRFVVDEWLLRDAGKHQFNPEHKQMLMERVAAELTRSGARSWSAGQLEDWLIGFLQANPALAAHYEGIRRDLLKEDLRTATFLVRDNQDQFRFAHSSLQEYFLACCLRRALIAGQFENWELRGVSPETLDFLGQSLQEQPSEAARNGLVQLRDTYRARAGELAFRYVLLALKKGYPTPAAAGFQLPGSDLFGLEVDHPGPALLDLNGLNLTGARIANTFWRRCRLDGTDFSSADAARAEWQECDLTATKWNAAQLEAALFRKCSLPEAGHAAASVYRAKWLSSLGPHPMSFPQPPPGPVDRRLQTGHSSSVYGCAWSPDGGRVLSASWDQSLKIWDAASGECLRTLSGHGGAAWGCAWSSDGMRILAGFADGSIRIFDAATLTEIGPRCYHLHPPHEQPTWASFDPVRRRVLHYGEGAWRSVGCVIPDENGKPMWLPLEAFEGAEKP